MSTYNNLLQVRALLVERPGSAGAIHLPQKNVPQLLSVMGAGQVIDLAGTTITSSEILGYGAIRYFKDVFGDIKDRMADKEYRIENTKVADVTIPLDKSRYKAIQLLAEDLTRGLNFVLSEKLNNIFKLLLIERETEGLATLTGEDTKKGNNTVNATAVKDGNLMYTRIVDMATDLRRTVDNNQGINKIPADRVIIFASPKLLNSLSRVRLLGDGVLKAFATGSFSVNTVGGYQIVESMYLPNNVEAIVTTTFAFKAPWTVKELSIGPKYPYAASDKVALAHIMRGGGIIYTHKVLRKMNNVSGENGLGYKDSRRA